MFILFTNLFLARPFRLENTLECYNLRGGQGGSTEVISSQLRDRLVEELNINPLYAD
jgi:hypothetical protein